jgi:hypothetical protein
MERNVDNDEKAHVRTIGRGEARTPSDEGTSGARALTVRPCEQCGRDINAKPAQRFCSGACRARFSRERKAKATADEIARLTAALAERGE